MKLTAERKALFIAELARHGVLARAARAASPQSPDQSGALQTFRDERARDMQFSADWDAAMESARAEVEHEIYRRAQEGWQEPVYGGRYREQVVGTVTRYSDRLLELRAKALMPVYRDKPPAGLAEPNEQLPLSMTEAIGLSIFNEARRLVLQGFSLLPSQEAAHVQS